MYHEGYSWQVASAPYTCTNVAFTNLLKQIVKLGLTENPRAWRVVALQQRIFVDFNWYDVIHISLLHKPNRKETFRTLA